MDRISCSWRNNWNKREKRKWVGNFFLPLLLLFFSFSKVPIFTEQLEISSCILQNTHTQWRSGSDWYYPNDIHVIMNSFSYILVSYIICSPYYYHCLLLFMLFRFKRGTELLPSPSSLVMSHRKKTSRIAITTSYNHLFLTLPLDPCNQVYQHFPLRITFFMGGRESEKRQRW